MNYLAHAYLSHETPQAIVGSFLGDFVKGSIDGRYQSAVCQGIMLHRKIDSYTDAHAIVFSSKRLMTPERRRYAGIMVDLFYDHFLARHWSSYSDIPLSRFTQQIYDALSDHYVILPQRLQRIFLPMSKDDWLGCYRELWAIDAALNGVSKQLKCRNTLYNSAEELVRNYDQLQQQFLSFFPQLVRYTSTYKAGINASPMRHIIAS